ncbi:hypothetical protein [Neptuniibacter sp. QD37_11]|uniref:hypothetical protein n=1 Tax=Neptuniibacter sp. QD37_11 TaxID=3398209 RepID=UPI0039F4A1DF
MDHLLLREQDYVIACMSLHVAETIRSQLGPQALALMGAFRFVASEAKDDHCGFLQFLIQGSEKVQKIRISLLHSDTYRIEYFKVPSIDQMVNMSEEENLKAIEAVQVDEGVYVEDMHRLIVRATGLFLHF